MRRLATLIPVFALLLILAFGGCDRQGSHPKSPAAPHVAIRLTPLPLHARPVPKTKGIVRQAQTCASADCGPYGLRMSWSSGGSFGFTVSGYFVTVNGTQIADTFSPYAIVGMDCGSTFVLGIQPHDSTGDVGVLYTSTYVSPACPPSATVVGTDAAPTPSCTVTVSSVATAASDLHSEPAGSTVCLASGTYGQMSVTSSVTQSPGVTLASATPGGATVAGVQMTAQMTNLTIEGLNATGSIDFREGDNSDKVYYNTIENFSGYAVESCNSCVNSGFTSTGLDVEYNQIDHTAYCLRFAGTGSMGDITFSHNVCGPGIGQGGSIDNHYTQTECVSGFIADNNVFEGPFNAASLSAGAHNNVSHACGSDFEFDNNIIWHSDSRAQEILWGDDGDVTTAQASNNLDIQDTTCGSTCPSIAMWLDGNGSSNSDSGVTFSNNTIIGSNLAQATSGGLFSRAGGITGFTVEDNISVNNNSAGVGDYSLGTCTTCDHNVSQDSSASGTGSVTGWTPSWQSTTWTPTDGSPWSPPPADYYKPVTGGGVLSTMGYQGTIGP